MRKIEQQMVNAVNNRRPWSGGNTQVSWDVNDSESRAVGQVHLYGHLIAWLEQHDGNIVVVPQESTFRNWPTRTTRSRLVALGVNACIKDFAPCIDGLAL